MSNLPTKYKESEDDVIIKIGDRIAKSDDPRDAVLLTQIRGEILKQNLDYNRKLDYSKDLSAKKSLERFKEKATLVYRIAMSPVALGVGCGFIYFNFLFIGYLVVGAGLWLLASELVKGYLLGGGKKQ